MKSARVRLLLAACLFGGWIGWLIYLAATTTTPIVLSRPQFLAADLDVIAEVKEKEGQPDSKVQVVEVLWVRKGIVAPRPGSPLQVHDLDDLADRNGWRGPGRYLLALQPVSHDEYKVASIPSSPGYPAPREDLSATPSSRRIYLVTPETRHQEEDIRHGKWD